MFPFSNTLDNLFFLSDAFSSSGRFFRLPPARAGAAHKLRFNL